MCGVLGLLAPVHRCARSVCCVRCAVSWASWLLFTGVPARCLVSRVRCPGAPGSCSPVCLLGVLCCVCSVLGLLAPVHRCACLVCCVACAMSWASWLLFTGVPAPCVVLRVRCPGTPGSCSPVCPLGVLFCVCGVLGLLAPVHQCARSVCCVGCAVSWASWPLFTGVPARCVVSRVRCPGPPGSVHRCARSVCCVACAVSWASWLLFTGVPALCVVLRVRCPGPPGSCSPCARSVCCFACAVSWASWLLFTGVPAQCVVFGVRCPGPPGSCSPTCPLSARVCGAWASWLLFTGVPARCVVLGVRCPAPWLLFTGVPLGVLFCVCGVLPPGSCSPVCPLGCVCGVLGPLAPVHPGVPLGLLAPVHRCARSVCCVGCAVSWAPWLLFTGVPGCVVSVGCPGPPGSCSPVRPLGVLCCVCGVLGLLAPVHRCACSVCCFACAVWAAVPARVLFRVCPGPPGSCSPVCPLRCGPPGSCSPVCARVLCWVCGVLGLLAPVHRAPLGVLCCVCPGPPGTGVRCPGPPGSCSPVCPLVVLCCVCGVLGPWLLFTGVPARCVVLLVRCPGPPGSCPPVCPLGVLLCVCGVLGLLAPVHRCARSVCCFACAVSWASWLLFTGVPPRCVVLGVRCPGPAGSCSRCARSVRCFACAVSWASWLLFTGAPARCVVLRVRCPGPPGSCSPVCPLGVLFCVCGVLGLLAPVHRCARSVCCFACAVSWAQLHTLLFTGVPARCVVLRVQCPGPPGSCSPVCLLGVLCCVCDVLGLLAPVHRCARSVCCVACAVS